MGVDELLAQEAAGDGQVLWALADNLGTNRDFVDNTGALPAPTYHLKYDSFGNVISGDAAISRYLYTGQEYDADTGLYYYNARWYDPKTGRFLSQDPLGFAAGDVNLYRYVNNGVVNATDPSGLAEEGRPGSAPTLIPQKQPRSWWNLPGIAYDGLVGFFWGAEEDGREIGEGIGRLVYTDFDANHEEMARMYDQLPLEGGMYEAPDVLKRRKDHVDEAGKVAGDPLEAGIAAKDLADRTKTTVKVTAAAGGLFCTSVGGISKKISLGIDPHLDDFSRKHGADSWKVWAKDDPLNWKNAFKTQMNDSNNQILFNLDGVDVWGGVTRGATQRGGATDWELTQIYQNRDWWSRIKWIKEGREVPNPFK